MNNEKENDKTQDSPVSQYDGCNCKTCENENRRKCPYNSVRNILGCRRFYRPVRRETFADRFDVFVELREYYGDDYLEKLNLI